MLTIQNKSKFKAFVRKNPLDEKAETAMQSALKECRKAPEKAAFVAVKETSEGKYRVRFLAAWYERPEHYNAMSTAQKEKDRDAIDLETVKLVSGIREPDAIYCIRDRARDFEPRGGYLPISDAKKALAKETERQSKQSKSTKKASKKAPKAKRKAKAKAHKKAKQKLKAPKLR